MLDSLELLEEIEQSRESRPKVNPARTACVRDMKSLLRAEELSGLSLTVIDETMAQFVPSIPQILEPTGARIIQEELRRTTSVVIADRHVDLVFYGMRIPGTDYSAGGVLLKPDIAPADMSELIQRSGRAERLWDAWCRQHSGIRPATASRLLAVTHLCLSMELMQSELLANNSSLVSQLSSPYEMMTLLSDLPRLFHAGAAPCVLADKIIRKVQQICETEWSAYSLNHRDTEWWQLYGEWGMSGDDLEALLQEYLSGRPPQVIVRNQTTCPQLRRKYPRLRSLVAVPLPTSQGSPCWLILANPMGRLELGTEEANLLKAVGHLLAGQIQQYDLAQSRS